MGIKEEMEKRSFLWLGLIESHQTEHGFINYYSRTLVVPDNCRGLAAHLYKTPAGEYCALFLRAQEKPVFYHLHEISRSH